MAVSNVSTYTSVYESAYSSSQTTTSKTESTQTAGSTCQTTDEYLSYLRQKYSNVNITVADFTSEKQMNSYMFSCSGGNNIAISSTILEKMASDPAAAEKYEKVIADVPKAAEEIKAGLEAYGLEMLACGTVIDRNGNVSYWCVGMSREAVENPGTKYKEKVQKQLEEKRAEKKEKEKAEAKKAEKEKTQERQQELRLASAKSKEELLEKIKSGDAEKLSAGAAEKLIAEGGFKGARVDCTV